MVRCSVVLTFESVDEIPWCDHSNETSLPVLVSQYFTKCNLGYFLNSDIWCSLELKGLMVTLEDCIMHELTLCDPRSD